jgi:hypothetical protein
VPYSLRKLSAMFSRVRADPTVTGKEVPRVAKRSAATPSKEMWRMVCP